MWTSSEAPWGESSVPTDLRAPEAARLVHRKVLLAPERTSCSVSAQAVAAMQTAMVTVPAWRLSLERRSGTTRPLGEGMEMFDRDAGEEKQQSPRKAPGFNPFRLF